MKESSQCTTLISIQSPPNCCCDSTNTSTSSSPSSTSTTTTTQTINVGHLNHHHHHHHHHHNENRRLSTSNGINIINGVNGNLGVGGGSGGGLVNSTTVLSPRERLEAFAADFDMIKPLLMYNIESIQSFRADCRYATNRKSRAK